MKIQIPGTLTELVEGWNGIERLLVAKRWERAAIVYAWTDPEGGSDTDPHLERLGVMGVKAFARLGLSGLTTPADVREYRKAWVGGAGENDDLLNIVPGDTVELPDLPWKDHYGEPTEQVQERVARSFIAKNPEVVVESIKALPAVAQAVADDREAFSTVLSTTPTVRKGKPGVAVAPQERDIEGEVSRAIGTLSRLLAEERAGQIAFGGFTETGLRLLGIALNERVARIDGDAAPDTITSINEYLRRKAKEETK